MPEYIEREALLDAIKNDVAPFRISMVFRHIHKAHAVDAVEVVRCRDCKFCEPSSVTNRYFCDWHREYFETMLDDFCSNGERKDNE